jgi:hypothetical protein
MACAYLNEMKSRNTLNAAGESSSLCTVQGTKHHAFVLARHLREVWAHDFAVVAPIAAEAHDDFVLLLRQQVRTKPRMKKRAKCHYVHREMPLFAAKCHYLHRAQLNAPELAQRARDVRYCFERAHIIFDGLKKRDHVVYFLDAGCVNQGRLLIRWRVEAVLRGGSVTRKSSGGCKNDEVSRRGSGV